MAQPSSRRWRATLVLAAVLSFLALPAARAVEPPAPHRAAAEPGLVSILWNALVRLWSPEGGGLDPHGITTTGDAGPGLDPSGSPKAVTGEEGPGLDPHG
jgi:hypothetical protein